jgi:hypothetical protein
LPFQAKGQKELPALLSLWLRHHSLSVPFNPIDTIIKKKKKILLLNLLHFTLLPVPSVSCQGTADTAVHMHCNLFVG